MSARHHALVSVRSRPVRGARPARAGAALLSSPGPCSGFVLDSRPKLGYIQPTRCSQGRTRGVGCGSGAASGRAGLATPPGHKPERASASASLIGQAAGALSPAPPVPGPASHEASPGLRETSALRCMRMLWASGLIMHRSAGPGFVPKRRAGCGCRLLPRADPARTCFARSARACEASASRAPLVCRGGQAGASIGRQDFRSPGGKPPSHAPTPCPDAMP